jgi:aconitase B
VALCRRRGWHRFFAQIARTPFWFTGEYPFAPNKRFGGACLGNKIAPIFYNTMEDSGALPIELM